MDNDKEGWTPFLLLICVEVTVGAVLPLGYCFGVVNGSAEFIKLWASESANLRYSANLTDDQVTLIWASIVAIMQIGGMIGSLCAAQINKRLGRRGTLQLSGVILVISALLHFFCRMANSVELLLLGRLLVGVAAGCVTSTHPMYLVELAPPKLSGSVGVFTCIGITGGVVVGQIFGFDFFWGTKANWHWALSGFVLFAFIGLLPLCFFPESPRYLIAQGDKKKAKEVLLKLRKSKEGAEKELAQMEDSSKMTEKIMSAKDVLCNSKLKMPLIIVCSFHIAQQGSGITAIWSYSASVFRTAGFTMSMALWLTFALGVLNFGAALCGPILMAHFNRRTMMMLSCLLAAVFLFLLSFGLYLMNNLKWMSYLCIFFFAMYILAFNIGLAPIPFFVGSELLLISPRAAVMALGSLFNWTTSFILAMTFPILSKIIGPFAFIPFAVICIYGFLLTYRYLPESRNHTPEDIAPLLENGFKSKIK